MKKNLEEIKELLKTYGQEHLLVNYEKFNDEEKEKLLDQISNIDFDLMKTLYENATKPVGFENVTIEPIEHVDKSKITVNEKEMYTKKGIEAIKYNKLAVVTMAGGQGTRLGHTGPKGTFIFSVKNLTVAALFSLLVIKYHGITVSYFFQAFFNVSHNASNIDFPATGSNINVPLGPV